MQTYTFGQLSDTSLPKVAPKPSIPLRTSLRRFEKRQLILPFSEKRATLPLNLQHFSGKCSPGPPGRDSCTLWAPLGVTGSLLLLLGAPWSNPWISLGDPCVPLGLSFVSLWSPLCRPGASRGPSWSLLARPQAPRWVYLRLCGCSEAKKNSK